MGIGIAEHQAGGFGEDYGLGVALARAAQVELFDAEGDVDVLGDVVGVDDEAIVGVAALVEHFGVQHVERAEVRADFAELDAPFHKGLVAVDHARELQLGEALHQAGTRQENLALGAVVAGEGASADADEVFLSERVGVVAKRVLGLVPDAAGEVHVLILNAVVDFLAGAEEEVFLHAEAHVDHGCFFLVGEAPGHFLAGDFLQGGLLHLHLEDLASVGLLLGKSLELSGLHVQLGGSTTHAHNLGAFGSIEQGVVGAGSDKQGERPVGAGIGDVGGDQTAVWIFEVREEDGFGGFEDGVLDFDVEDDFHAVVGDVAIDYVGSEGGFGGLGVDGVVFHSHGIAGASAGTARELVDGGGHGADAHDVFIDGVFEQLRRSGCGVGEGEGCTGNVLAAGEAVYSFFHSFVKLRSGL